MALEPHQWSLVIAVGTVIVVPALVGVGKKMVSFYRDSRDKRLADKLQGYISRKEMEVQFEQLQAIQAQQHAENRAFLDTIRSEAIRREERLTTIIQTTSAQTAVDTRELRGEVGKVNSRVDNVLQMLGDRRARPRN